MSSHDLDVMRDVYMTRTQREAFDRIAAAAALAATGKQQDAKLCTNCNGSGEGRAIVGYGPDDYYEVDATCSVCDGTGKQQVGEVQGSREQFEAWARPQFPGEEAFDRIAGRPGGWEYTGNAVQAAWAAWQAALAARQPVGQERIYRERPTHNVYRGSCGSLPCHCWADADHVMGDEVKRHAAPPAQGIDLGQLRALAEKFDGYGDDEVGDTYSGPYYQCALELRSLIKKLDAAPGVGNIQPPRDLRTKLGEA